MYVVNSGVGWAVHSGTFTQNQIPGPIGTYEGVLLCPQRVCQLMANHHASIILTGLKAVAGPCSFTET